LSARLYEIEWVVQARQGKARQGKARQGKAMQGNARQKINFNAAVDLDQGLSNFIQWRLNQNAKANS
jgi:hypothetical protein